MPHLDFISALHKRTKRDYVGRVNEFPKAQAAAVAKRFDADYWDGERKFGYGGMRYDGRWRPVADAIVKHYALKPGDRVLDVGCGKGFLLYDLTQSLPGVQVQGIDISRYAIEHAKAEIRSCVSVASATSLPFPDHHFDLVISINTLHNLYCYDLDKALREVVRVGGRPRNGDNGHACGAGTRDDLRGDFRGYLVVESYRNEEEKANLLYWQLTCECFFTPQEWAWWFDHCGYTGDYSFIFFE